jgi:SNF2 family DNA or RNA helicase
MAIVATRVKDRIHVHSPYDPEVVRTCKTVPGASFSKLAGNAWTYPLTIESCLLLREAFGARLVVTQGLGDWYREAASKRTALGTLATAPDAALRLLPNLAPKLAAAMETRTYQRAATAFVAQGDRYAGVFDDPGLGKTLEVLGGLVESGVEGPFLVVSPKTAAQAVWPREIKRWLGDEEHTAIDFPENRAGRDTILDALRNHFLRLEAYAGGESGETYLAKTWVCVHPEMVRTKSWWECPECSQPTPYTRKPTSVLGCGHAKPKKIKKVDEHVFPQLFDIAWGAVVVDECHESLVVKSGTPTQRRNGLDLLRLRDDAYRIATSGTPCRSKPEQLWGILNWLAPKIYGGKWRWIEQYWHLGGYTGYEIGEIREEREKMLWAELSPIIIRRTKDEVAADLPAKTYVGTPYDPSDEDSPVGIWLPMEPAQSKAYREMEKTGEAKLLRGKVEAVGIAERTRLKQLACAYATIDRNGEYKPMAPSNKLNWTRQFLEEMGFPNEPTGKVIIVSQWVEMLDLFKAELAGDWGYLSCTLSGDITGARRTAMIDDFNKPVGSHSPHIMFLSVRAGGTAITIDSADHMIMIDETEGESDVMRQVEDRIHRVSKPRPVSYYYLRSEGTIDTETAVKNVQAAKRTGRLLDERRGVKSRRNVLEAVSG